MMTGISDQWPAAQGRSSGIPGHGAGHDQKQWQGALRCSRAQAGFSGRGRGGHWIRVSGFEGVLGQSQQHQQGRMRGRLAGAWLRRVAGLVVDFCIEISGGKPLEWTAQKALVGNPPWRPSNSMGRGHGDLRTKTFEVPIANRRFVGRRSPVSQKSEYI